MWFYYLRNINTTGSKKEKEKYVKINYIKMSRGLFVFVISKCIENDSKYIILLCKLVKRNLYIYISIDHRKMNLFTYNNVKYQCKNKKEKKKFVIQIIILST